MDWEWSGIFESIVGGVITTVALWLITRIASRARNKGELQGRLQSHYFRETIDESVALQFSVIPFVVIISITGSILFLSLLRLVLVPYNPMLWHDFLGVVGSVSSSICLIYFGLLFAQLFSDSGPGKERIKLKVKMGALVAFAIFSDMYPMNRDDLFIQANVDRITDAINEKDHQHFVQELKSLYPRLTKYGLFTPSIEPVRTGKPAYDETWYEYHVTFLKALRRQIRDSPFDLAQWNIDVERKDKTRKESLEQTE